MKILRESTSISISDWQEEHHRMNWPFPSSPGPLFQNESRCSAFDMEIIFHSLANETHFHKKGCAPSLIFKVRVFGTRKWPIVFNNWRTIALRTPRYNGHPDNTDSSKIPGNNKLQTFDWNKLPQVPSLANEDTDPRSLQCPLFRELTVFHLCLETWIRILCGWETSIVLIPYPVIRKGNDQKHKKANTVKICN